MEDGSDEYEARVAREAEERRVARSTIESWKDAAVLGLWQDVDPDTIELESPGDLDLVHKVLKCVVPVVPLYFVADGPLEGGRRGF